MTRGGRPAADPPSPGPVEAMRAGHAISLSRLGVRLLILFLWCWSWLPQLIDLLIVGRQSPGLRTVAERSELASATYIAIIAAILATALFLVVVSILSGQPFSTASIFVILTPWVALNGVYVFQGGRITEVLLFPLVAIAFVLNYDCLRNAYGLLRSLILITAISSIALGIAQPNLFLSDPRFQVSSDKAIVGDLLLNGLFPTSNQLGVTLALGIPLLVTASGKRTRWLGTAIALSAMVWASSRTALAATAVVLLVMAILPRGRTRATGRVIRPLVLAFTVLGILLPFILTTPSLLSGRVSIWRTSLDHVVNTDLFFGAGAMIFREVSPVTTRIGAITATGHNVFVSIFTIGGILAVLAMSLLFVTYLDRAVSTFDADPYPLLFLLALSAMSVLEDPLRGFVIAPSSFLIIPVIAMALVDLKRLHNKNMNAGRRGLTHGPRHFDTSGNV